MRNPKPLSIVTGLLLAPLAWAADAPTTRPAASAGDELLRKLLEKPFTDMIDKRDPLGHIAGEMESSKDLLAGLKTNTPTQIVQGNIITDLDAFIAMLEKQKKIAKAGGGNPTNPLPDSVLAGGPGGQGDMHDPNASSRLWGQLPPKQREQILQSQMQGFPVGYESILSSYYKRLAQENVSDSSSTPAPAAPATQPAR